MWRKRCTPSSDRKVLPPGGKALEMTDRSGRRERSQSVDELESDVQNTVAAARAVGIGLSVRSGHGSEPSVVLVAVGCTAEAIAGSAVALADLARNMSALRKKGETYGMTDSRRELVEASTSPLMAWEDVDDECPECFGKGLQNQDDRPGLLLGPLGEFECRACRGTGRRLA